jgi:hydrogenase maturation protease
MRILVAGLGNILKRDDGLGPFVVERLRLLKLRKNVEVLELGTPGLSLLHYVEGYDKVIFVDAVQRGGKPGSIYVLKPHRLVPPAEAVNPRDLHSLSIHEIGLEKALAIGRALGEMPDDMLIIGCEPEDITTSRIGLTDRVKKAVPKVIELILKELDTEQ